MHAMTQFSSRKKQITGHRNAWSRDVRLEKKSDTERERSGRVKDQGRIMEAQSDASIRMIDRTYINGRWLNCKS
jgi:hypothetical protein